MSMSVCLFVLDTSVALKQYVLYVCVCFYVYCWIRALAICVCDVCCLSRFVSSLLGPWGLWKSHFPGLISLCR